MRAVRTTALGCIEVAAACAATGIGLRCMAARLRGLPQLSPVSTRCALAVMQADGQGLWMLQRLGAEPQSCIQALSDRASAAVCGDSGRIVQHLTCGAGYGAAASRPKANNAVPKSAVPLELERGAHQHASRQCQCQRVDHGRLCSKLWRLYAGASRGHAPEHCARRRHAGGMLPADALVKAPD